MGIQIDLEKLVDRLEEHFLPEGEHVASYHKEFMLCYFEVLRLIEKLKLEWEEEMDTMMEELKANGLCDSAEVPE